VRYTRIFNDATGTSHFEDLDIALARVEYAPPALPIDLSAPFAVSRALLSSFPAGWFGDWHPTPCRQLYFNLSGRFEVVVSDGQSRTFGPGDIVLIEDVEPPGHTTRTIGDVPSTGVFVHLAVEDRTS